MTTASDASRDGFRLVTGHLASSLIGFTLGETLPANTAWWRGFKGDIDPELLRETGSRTFAINENTPAYTAYLSWGFRVIGQLQPFDDSPVYEAMVAALPASRSGGAAEG